MKCFSSKNSMLEVIRLVFIFTIAMKFFVVSFVNDVFGQDYPGECVEVRLSTQYIISRWNSDLDIIYDIERGVITVIGEGQGSVGWDTAYYNAVQIYYWDSDKRYNNWTIRDNKQAVMRESKGWGPYPPDPLPANCPNRCEEKKIELEVLCGGEGYVDWSTWNDEECTGECRFDLNLAFGPPDTCK